MSDLRRKNGQQDPWSVKYWGIGNEAWGCGGNMTAEHYADVLRTYVTFMNNTQQTRLFKIASGANGSDYHWTETLMKNIPLGMVGGLGVHHYSVIEWRKKGSATDYTEEQYFKTMKSALFMEEIVQKHAAIMDKYDPQKRVAMVVDEWGGWYDVEPGTNPGFLYQQNTLRDAMIAGVTLNTFNNHADRVRMANLAQCVNVLQAVILTNEEKMILTPTYHVMEMYNVHQDAKLIPITVTSADYVLGDEKLPAVSASASKDSLGVIHISLVNIDAKKAADINLNSQSGKINSVTGRILTSGDIHDHNTFENPNKVKPEVFNGAKVSGNNIEVKLPPFSVVVLTLK